MSDERLPRISPRISPKQVEYCERGEALAKRLNVAIATDAPISFWMLEILEALEQQTKTSRQCPHCGANL